MRNLFIFLAAIALALTAPGAQAQYGQGFARPPSFGDDSLSQPIRPLKPRQNAIDEAVSRYGGEVLSARVRRGEGGDPFYEIRLIAKGQVRVVRIDARPD